tara:strand:- start:113 stop:445 length:333 start_codon:yes stop_codon:yes gene_type:complete
MDEEQGTWKNIEPAVWKPQNEGDSIEGVLVNEEPKTQDLSAMYSIENAEGQVLVWGSAVLDDRMQYVNVGSKVRITFKGMTKNKKGQNVKLFKVETQTVQKEQKVDMKVM